MDNNPRLEIPEIETTPIALKIKNVCGISNDQITVVDINAFLFDDPESVENQYYLTTSISDNKNEILNYLEGLSEQIVASIAKKILQFDIDFFDIRYSRKLEIHGETYQIMDNLTASDLGELENNKECLELYRAIKSQELLLSKLTLAKMRVRSLKPVSWTEGIFEN